MELLENFIKQVDDALEAREIIKIKVLNNSFLNPKEVANELAEKTGAEFVQSIGNKFVLYRESKKNKRLSYLNSADIYINFRSDILKFIYCKYLIGGIYMEKISDRYHGRYI